MKTVNGTRNPFAVREALDKRSASVFPVLTRDRFFRQFIFQYHNFLIHLRIFMKGDHSITSIEIG